MERFFVPALRSISEVPMHAIRGAAEAIILVGVIYLLGVNVPHWLGF